MSEQSKYDVMYNGEVLTTVNKYLAVDKNLSDENLEKLKESHIKRYELLLAMKNTNENDKETLMDLASKVTEVEFYQQELWGFPKDASFHMWFTVPHCKCPYHDNMERRGTNYQITVQNCPIHGWE